MSELYNQLEDNEEKRDGSLSMNQGSVGKDRSRGSLKLTPSESSGIVDSPRMTHHPGGSIRTCMPYPSPKTKGDRLSSSSSSVSKPSSKTPDQFSLKMQVLRQQLDARRRSSGKSNPPGGSSLLPSSDSPKLSFNVLTSSKLF